MIESATICRNPPPGLLRRLASMVYESLLLAAVLFVAAFVYILLRNPQAPGGMLFFRLYLALVIAAYFLWFWTHGGQTLAMKTWRLRLIAADGSPVRARMAAKRLLFAVLGIAAFGIGILWALWDPDRQFLHDRLAGTQLMRE
ncbi:RDD family protein [Thiobacter aerophilum]|uniref:RDD family protein n=1 Tax=Thiobacter aerophilum TaxID=3121275 RepID=A0ABV0EKU7_9BURK